MNDPTTPSRCAGLRDALRRAVCEAEGFAWDSDMLEPDEYGDHADAVLAVLYREWPWLRAEAEDAAVPPVDRAAVLREAADALERMPGYPRLVLPEELLAELRRLAGEAAHDKPDTATCAHCGREIENRGDPSMDGNHEVRWVHVPGGYTVCFPQQAATSPRATPAQPGGETEARVSQSEPVPDTPRCTNPDCRHPKRDHSDRKDHTPSPVVPRRPWCHACNAECDYAEEGDRG